MRARIMVGAIVLVALLTVSMRGSIKSASVNYWASAWMCLCLALVSLFIGIHVGSGQKLFFSGYFLGEYAFGLLFIAGCRHYATGARLNRRAIFIGNAVNSSFAKWHSYMGAGGLTSGLIFDIGQFQIIPTVAFDGLYLHETAYGESGAGALGRVGRPCEEEGVRARTTGDELRGRHQGGTLGVTELVALHRRDRYPP